MREPLSTETTTEMLNIVKEIEDYAESLKEIGAPEVGEERDRLEGWAIRMRQVLPSGGPGKRRRKP